MKAAGSSSGILALKENGITIDKAASNLLAWKGIYHRKDQLKLDRRIGVKGGFSPGLNCLTWLHNLETIRELEGQWNMESY